jgi:hypothetical protein
MTGVPSSQQLDRNGLVVTLSATEAGKISIVARRAI